MRKYFIRRLIVSIAMLWLVATAVFLFVHILPGDPADIILGASEQSQPTPEQVATVRGKLGLDKPLFEQYVAFMGDLARLDLGESFISERPVALDLRLRFGRTLQLMVPALILSTVLGMTLGILAAGKKGGVMDPLLSAAGLIGFSVPVFVVGNVLVLVLAVNLGWLPSSGFVELTRSPIDALRYMVMPVFALALAPMAATMRMMRTTTVEELTLDYVRTAHAKGLGDRLVLYRHVLKNAMLPVVAVIGLQVGAAFSGAVIVEYVFNWPGVGRLLLQAIGSRDYPLIRGTVLMASSLFVIVNLVTDLVYAYLNPRLRQR